ncbi:MAG: pentapeptide repeat-containing protein [Pirellulales bacterium]|nr:pentapeptide repeat-containing protein [Pirellulales bacterium]
MTKHWTILVTASLATLLALLAPALVARADIFEWEYINPGDPSQGKQQSTMLCPDGAGANAVPGEILFYRNFTMAYLIGANLTGAYLQGANLTDAELSQANLTNTNFEGFWSDYYLVPGANFTSANLTQANLTNTNFIYATLTGANFTNAEVRRANFYRDSYGGSGITLAQLYSTASRPTI